MQYTPIEGIDQFIKTSLHYNSTVLIEKEMYTDMQFYLIA